MAIIRTKRPENYTVISNDVINDTRLDWRDLGLLIYLLSKPDNWEISVSHLKKVRKASRDAIYASMRSLASAGYVTGKANPKGGFDYKVYDTPQNTPLTENPLTENPLTENPLTENPLTENPLTENPLTENPTQVNTDISINTEIVIMPPPENFVSPDECELTVEKMGGELQACFEWAKEHEFWNFVAHESISKFLKLYSNKKPDGIRAQFERRNDPRNTTGGNNGTRQQSARPAKVSATTKVEQAIAERDKHKREMATVIDGEFKYG